MTVLVLTQNSTTVITNINQDKDGGIGHSEIYTITNTTVEISF